MIRYPAKLLFRIEEAIKSVSPQQKLKEFITTTPVLQEVLQAILQTATQNL